MSVTKNPHQTIIRKDDVEYTVDHQYDAMRDEYAVRVSDSRNLHSFEYFPKRFIDPRDMYMAIDWHERKVKTHPDYRHDGPTNKDLQHPAVRNAWNEYLLVHRLSIGDRK